MRILVNDFAGYAFPAQLSRELARREHQVLHVHCSSVTSGKGALARRPDDPAGLAFGEIDLGEPFARHSMRRRFRQEQQCGRKLVELARDFEPDVVLSADMPLFGQQQIQNWARRSRRGFVYWQQDVISVAMGAELRNRIPLAGSIGARYLARVERRLLTRSDAVIVISPDFLPALEHWGVEPSTTHVIENWAPIEDLPVTPRRNPWAEEQGLVEPFVFLYAGTLGLKHNPELLIRLAGTVAPLGAVVVVVSEGTGAAFVESRAHALGLKNVRVIPFQPHDRLPEVLGTADVLVAILEPGAGIFSVPSKVLAYFCAARPILAAIPRENLAARTLEGASAGLVVEPGDYTRFVSAGVSLMSDQLQRGEAASHARAYAEHTFEIESIGDIVEGVLVAAHQPSQGGAPART